LNSEYSSTVRVLNLTDHRDRKTLDGNSLHTVLPRAKEVPIGPTATLQVRRSASGVELQSRSQASTVIVSPVGLFRIHKIGFAEFWTARKSEDTANQADIWRERARFVQRATIVTAAIADAAQSTIIATGDASGSARIWRMENAADVEPSDDPQKVIAWACRHVSRNLTTEERFKYAPEAIGETCPIPADVIEQPLPVRSSTPEARGGR
jgi:hypothetical protein